MGTTRSTKRRTANPGSLKAILDANKFDTRLLGDVQTYMLARNEVEDVDNIRSSKVLHPSEICKADWCPRASYYTVTGEPESDPAPPDGSYVLENIWDEGHEVNAKWQSRLWAMGRLRGEFRCLHCSHIWEAVSPALCPACACPALKYREVPVFSEKYLIGGRADGDIVEGGAEEDDPLLEVKTIGLGTVRIEQPGLLASHTFRGVNEKGDERTVVDFDGLWKNLKRPFISHINQATLYGLAKGRKHIVFIYEYKPNQQTKEFVVRVREEKVASILDGCLDVVYAKKVGKPPGRPGWADLDCKACQGCAFRTTCWDTRSTKTEKDAGTNEPRSDADGNGRRSASRVGEEGSAPSGETTAHRQRRRPAEADAPGVRLVRRRPDADVHGVHPLDGLSRR